MKIEYLFSRNKKWGSRLIAWAAKYEKLDLEDNPSHIAVLVNNRLVIESTLGTGVRMIPYKKWKEINEELYKIPCDEAERPSRQITNLIDRIWGKKYDWKGIAYFAYCYLRLIFLNERMPARNKWERKSHYFCTEFVGKLVGKNYSMKSPARICNDWLKDEK